ncbi:hypothetical protein QP168_10390, partial [Aerococcus urinae]|nr:hypothetical protein [Aerococcus urinae]
LSLSLFWLRVFACAFLVALTSTASLASTAAATGSATITAASAAVLLLSLLASKFALGHVALVDPHLDTDTTEGRACLVESIVNVRA